MGVQGYILDAATVAKLAAVSKAYEQSGDVTTPQFSKTGPVGEHWFYAILQNTGPLGTEDDYTDGRYWFCIARATNTDATDTTAVTIAANSSGDPFYYVGTATNLFSDVTHSLDVTGNTTVLIHWSYSTDGKSRFTFSSLPSGVLFRVNLTQTGGSGGSAIAAPNFTYSAYSLTDATTPLATGASPEWAARSIGAFTAATAGQAYYTPAGGFVLSVAYETAIANLCGTYSG